MKIPILLVLIAVGFSHAAEKGASGGRTKRAILALAQEDEAALRKFEREVKEASRMADALKADKRKPSKEDVSGVWSTGPNLVGRTFQLEQTKRAITGRGFHWGCTGISSVFTVRGHREKEGLTLTFLEPHGKKETYHLTYSTKGRYPRFASTDKEKRMRMETNYETEETIAAEASQASSDETPK